MRTPRLTVLWIAIGLTAAAPGRAAELEPRTAAAFDRYVAASEAQRDMPGPFLWLDEETPPRKEDRARVRGGGLLIERLETRDNGRPIPVPGGLIHHWLGTVFIPGATLQDTVRLLQDYDRHGEIYRPNVAQARLLNRDGDRFRIHLRFFMKRVITVVVNSEHDAVFTRHGPGQVSSRIASVRIAEVENPGLPQERELPVGRDGGYLWRLNSYWRLVERDGGVYVQCESISLTRGIPFGLGWIVGPFVTSIPRETLTFTLETTRSTLSARR